jgi:hypothetical protein
MERTLLKKISVDGKPIEGWHMNISGKVLQIKPLSIDEIHQTLDQELIESEDRRERERIIQFKYSIKEPMTIYVFRIPINRYTNLEKEIREFKDKEVDMGEFHSLLIGRELNAVITVNLEKNFFYDIFVFSGLVFLGGGRLSTGSKKEGIPYEITFEEMKFLALKKTGVDFEEAKGVKAKIIPMTAWGERGRYIIAGFCLDPENEDKLTDHTIMVNHCCGIEYSHGHSREDFLHFFKKKGS